MAYRQNGAEGTPEPAGWHRIRDAYLAAGGDPETVATTPDKILTALCRVYPDWLHGPARRRVAEEEEMALAGRRGMSLRS